MAGVSNIPIFPNRYPYNDMLLNGILKIKGLGVKTRSWDWSYRGPVLFYNSKGRAEKICIKAHEFNPKTETLGTIIGVGRLVNVRALSEKEQILLLSQFNNCTLKEARDLAEYQILDKPFVEPLEIGFFFSELRRFQKPIPFHWPSRPVKPIMRDIGPFKKQLVAAGMTI